MPLKILTWNVDGFRAMLQRRNETASAVLQKLGADIVCLQETKFSRADEDRLGHLCSVPGWHSYAGLCRVRSSYAGLITLCRDCVPVLAAEEGLSATGTDRIWDRVDHPPQAEWNRLSQEQLRHNDDEGRAVITDHGEFVLVHLYGPAVTDISAERFPRKLTFYQALQMRIDRLVGHGRSVLLAGDLNIARLPVDNCDWADSKLPPQKLLEAFVEDRPDRQWFLDFLDESSRQGAPVDLLRRFHPERRRAYTVWGRTGGKRERNFGSRVDYILLAEHARDPAATPQPATGLLSRARACDIQSDWTGSDHAPVWATFDIELPKRDPQGQLPGMESRARFRPSGQRQLTSWLTPKPGKRKRSAGSPTPPRRSLGEELSASRRQGSPEEPDSSM